MGRMINHEYRATTVYIDAYDGHVLQGGLWNPFLGDEEHAFSSTMDFLCLMDNMLNDMQFPQPFEQNRSFADAFTMPAAGTRAAAGRHGKLATFTVRIFYRQNASWQGTINWNEQQQEEGFRSVLELLTLMHSALTR